MISIRLQLFGGRGAGGKLGYAKSIRSGMEYLRSEEVQKKLDLMTSEDFGSYVNPTMRMFANFISEYTNKFEGLSNKDWVGLDFKKYGAQVNEDTGRSDIYELQRYMNGYQMNTGDYSNVSIAQSLDLHSIGFNKRGFIDFSHYLLNESETMKSRLNWAFEERRTREAASKKGRRRK